MSIQPGNRTRYFSAFVLGVGALITLAVLFADQTAKPTSGADEGPAMRLEVTDANCNDSGCLGGTNEFFTLQVDFESPPVDGYELLQTSVFWGSNILYEPSLPAIDEILWPDCLDAVAV